MRYLRKDIYKNDNRNGNVFISSNKSTGGNITVAPALTGEYLPATKNDDGSYLVDLENVYFTGNILSQKDIVAYLESEVFENNNTLEKLDDIDFNKLEEGDIIVYENGKWINKQIELGAGGIDENELNKYLGNYVTTNTIQNITALKIFTEEVRFIGNGTYSDPAVGVRCGLKSQLPIATGGFIKAGGTSSQFLKADGSVDGNAYVNKTGDTMTGVLDVKTDVGGAINIHTLTTATNPFMRFWRAGTAMGNLGFDDTNGFGLYNYACNKHLSIKNDGTLHFEGSKIWNENNDGSGSGLDADLLDGKHASDFSLTSHTHYQINNNGRINNPTGTDLLSIGLSLNEAYNSSGFPFNYGNIISLRGTSPSGGLLFCGWRGDNITGKLWYKSKRDVGEWGEWKQIAYTTDNVASATKLQTARTIYIDSYNNYKVGDGVNFNGENNITLKLPNTICTSDWFRSYGGTGWYNQTYGGGIYMIDTVWVRVYNNKSFYSPQNILAGGEITAYSDARLKSDIKPLQFRTPLKPKTYIKDGKKQIGFIAQDVQENYPELVHESNADNNNYLSLNYNGLIAVLAAQLNEMENKITKLENEIKELKGGKKNETI